MASQNGEKEESDHILRHSFDVASARERAAVHRKGLVCIFALAGGRAKIKVATSVFTGGSNMPPAYCDLIFRVPSSFIGTPAH